MKLFKILIILLLSEYISSWLVFLHNSNNCEITRQPLNSSSQNMNSTCHK